MSDAATPNLPSHDFENTFQFYSTLGFTETWRDKGWMILKRGSLTLEFFPHPDLDPLASWFSRYSWQHVFDVCRAFSPTDLAGVPASLGMRDNLDRVRWS